VSTDVHLAAVKGREAKGAAASSKTRVRQRAWLAPAEREQKGEDNSLGGKVCLDITRRFTEVNMIRKGQVKRLVGSDAQGQATFVASLFGIAA
jgi:hypothetical protein